MNERRGMIRSFTLFWQSMLSGADRHHLDHRTSTHVEWSEAPAPETADRTSSIAFQITVERLIYILIAVAAVATRFWDLSSRAMNHDESLHTYYSWVYYDSFRYVHDPLMHGPFLFHLNAFFYFLFGASDYVGRLGPAIFGTLLVLMPALLRSPRLLGRWGAISASLLILVSPSILYYSRFIRHDIYALFATFAIAIAALRYYEKPERRWLVIAGAFTGLLFCTKEVSFIVAFIMVTFVVAVATWQAHRLLFATVVGVVIAAGVTVLALQALGVQPFPEIPWEDPTEQNIRQFVIDAAQHPAVLAVTGIFGLGIVAILMISDRMRTADGGWLHDVIGRTPPGTTAHTLYMAIRDRRGMQFAFASGLSIFVILYTSLFTNVAGLVSATFGALGYWLGQQDVQRGEQPWFYYLLLAPQYEFIIVLLFPVAAALTAVTAIARARKNEVIDRRLYCRVFFLYWAVMMLAILSWASEKMPWLIVHLVLPMILLVASHIGEWIESLEARFRAGDVKMKPALALAGFVPLVAIAWFALWAWGTAGPWEYRDDIDNYVRTLQPAVSDNPWILYIPLIALIVGYLVSLKFISWNSATKIATVALCAVALIAQFHVSYRFTYEEGDVAVDMLMYSQASPDTARTIEELGQLSRTVTGGKDLEVWYDSGTSWPFQWYLRDYDNRRFYGTELSEPPSADVVLIATEYLDGNEEMLDGYTYEEYTMRWFFPENPTYRRFAIAPELNDENRQNYFDDRPGPYSASDAIGSALHSIASLRDPEQQGKMFRLVAYRELWDQIRSDYTFRVYVRDDLMPAFNHLRY
ncbi:MAG: flippase activity-associated protein Agl23 [Chloroflexota bacterium]